MDTRLDTSPRLDDPDGLFAGLVAAHEGLTPAASRQLDAQLVLLLANHIGSTAVVLDALRLAREALLPDLCQNAGYDGAGGDDSSSSTEAIR